MNPNLKVVPEEENDIDMRERIEEIRQRANPNGNYSEYWHVLKCQGDRQYLLECIEALLWAKD